MEEPFMAGIPSLLKAQCHVEKTGNRWVICLDPAVLMDAAARMKERGFFLEDITGLDTTDGLTALYHFDHYTDPGRVAFYVIVSRTDPAVPSISSIYSGAEWHERECHDFFGIQFTDHPHLDPLLLPDDLAIHPLLKDDTARIPLKDFLVFETIIEKDADFTLLDETDGPDDADETPNDTEGGR